MSEIDELGSGIDRLKKNYESQKRLVEKLERDRAFLIDKTRFLGEKLTESYMVYEEAGRRILDFVDKEIGPLKGQISEIRAELKKVSGLELELKSQSSFLGKIRSYEDSLKSRILESEKTLRELRGTVAVVKGYTEKLREAEAKGDKNLDSGLSEVKGHLESRLKVAEDRIGLKMAEASEETLQDAMDAVNPLAARQEETRKKLSETAVLAKQLSEDMDSAKKQLRSIGLLKAGLEKRVSSQQSSLRGIESSISRMSRGMESAALQKQRFEKKLAGTMKGFEGNVEQKIGQLKSGMDERQKRQADAFGAGMDALKGEVEGKISGLSKRMDGIKLADDKLEKRLAGARKNLEGNVDAKISQLKAGAEEREKKHSEIFEARIRSLRSELRADAEAKASGLSKRLDGIKLADESLEKRLAEVKKHASEIANSGLSDIKSKADSIHKRQSEVLNSRMEVLSSDLEGRVSKVAEALETQKAGISKEIAGLRKHASEKEAALASGTARSIKGLESLLMEQRRKEEVFRRRAEKRLSGQRDSITGLQASLEKASKRLDSAKLEGDSFEKRLAGALKDFERNNGARIGQLESGIEERQKKQSELLEARTKVLRGETEGKISGLSKRLDSISLEDEKLEKRLAEVRKHADGIARSGLEGMRSDMEAGRKKQSEILEARMKAHRGEIDARISGLSKKLDGISLEDEKFEKKLAGTMKGFEGDVDQKMVQLKSGIEERQKRQAEILESRAKALRMEVDSKVSGLLKRLDSISLEDEKLEKRLSDMRKHAEILVRSGLETYNKKQQEIASSGMAAISEDLSRKLSRIQENVSAEKGRIREIESSIDKKLADSQKLAAARISGLEERNEKRISQALSHVASEGKALSEARADMESDLKEEGKTLSERMGVLAERLEKQVSGLSAELSGERAAFLKERAKLSGRVLNAERAAARAEETVKSFEEAVEQVKASPGKDSPRKIKSLEAEIGRISSAVSSLGRQIKSVPAKGGSEKALSDIGARLKRLQTDGSLIASRVEGQESSLEAVKKELAEKEDSRSLVERKLAEQGAYVKSLEAALGRVVKKLDSLSLEKAAPAAGKDFEKRLASFEAALKALSGRSSRSEQAVEQMEGKLTELDGMPKTGMKEPEIRAQLERIVRSDKEASKPEMAKMAAEVARLKQEISEWKQEQARLYELLEED